MSAATRTVLISFGFIDLAPKFFFDDSDTNEHEDATEADCAEEARKYIADRGHHAFVTDWDLLVDVPIYVGGEQVYP